MNFSANDIEITLNVLQQIADNPALIDSHDRVKTLIAKIYKQGRKAKKQHNKQKCQLQDKALISTTDIVKFQQNQRETTEQLPALESGVSRNFIKPKSCYICKKLYTEIHHFYHLLCPSCARFNYAKREQHTDLTGRVALVTGGRIKIGYQTALRLLQDGAKVIVTSRFPGDTLRRFRNEHDFEQWQKRLCIYGLDLRDLPAVESFIKFLIPRETHLDILINNAAQTIKRPLAFYQHLLEQEKGSYQALNNNHFSPSRLLESKLDNENISSEINVYFPKQMLDRDGQQLDQRPLNSWKLKLDEVSTLEMLEVQLVNTIAPFMLNSQLKPLLTRSPFAQRFIINVSAMEGQFNREHKTVFHPHTNMAKAALNMMTRTSGADYARDRIYMNSVDTGWITDENPYPQRENAQKQRGFYPPLDIIDGMARIYDPIIQAIENPHQPLFGHFLKNYIPYPW